MKQAEIFLNFFLDMAKAQAIMSRRFDGKLGGLGFNEFVIMHYLNLEPEGKLRRVDLAEKVGLTPSGVTRLLLPMEKVGYIKREFNKLDGRVSYVALSAAGKRKLTEGMERMEVFFEDMGLIGKEIKLEGMLKLLKEICK